MRNRVLLGVLALAVACSAPALAGKNDGGSLIVHTNNDYNWSNLTVCTATEGTPASCEAVNTLATRDEGQVIWVLASFHPDASPGVSVVYFGIEYDDTNLDPGVNVKVCGPSGTLEVPDDDWPYGGRGNSVAFGSAVTEKLFPVYAFRVNGGITGSYFRTAANPTGGYAAFVDDENPPGTDNITKFGEIRWNEEGTKDCPAMPRPGGCCLTDTIAGATCIQVLSEAECRDSEGLPGKWLGVGVGCDPNPCGACCYWQDQGGAYTRQCIVTSWNDCKTNLQTKTIFFVTALADTVGPRFHALKVCAADPNEGAVAPYWFCADPQVEGPSPTKTTSWGALKSLFR